MPGPNDILSMEDVRIIFRNFKGEEGMYNRAGARNFAVVLPEDVAEQLANDGWNVKLLKARPDDDEVDDQGNTIPGRPTPYLSVAVEFDKGRPPTVNMIGMSSGRRTQLDKDTVDVLDSVDIGKIDLTVRPYDWEVNGNTGRKAYLQAIYVHIIEDPLQLKYDNMDIATVAGPMMDRTEMMVDPITGRKTIS
jgi:hypothetical protein